jgi:hypothetical protein
MISIPIAVYNGLFQWQLDLFWYNHRKVYGDKAWDKALAVVVDRNKISDIKCDSFNWFVDVPYCICKSYFDYMGHSLPEALVPLNIQTGLKQVINSFEDEEIIELIDCDMFHLREHPVMDVEDDEFFVCDIYEKWHLRSLSNNKHIVEKYLVNGHGSYNGGFVPIIGKAKTFKKILDEWIDLHIKMVNDHLGPKFELIRWWCGMYSFQAVCANNRIKLTTKNWCHVPPETKLSENHYICHYSCDKTFDKKKFAHLKIDSIKGNEYYDSIREWFEYWKSNKKRFKSFL